MNMVLPVLPDESGYIAMPIEEQCQMLMDHEVPLPPSDPCDDYIFKSAGDFHKSISGKIFADTI
jgi:hypothetical protein